MEPVKLFRASQQRLIQEAKESKPKVPKEELSLYFVLITALAVATDARDAREKTLANSLDVTSRSLESLAAQQIRLARGVHSGGSPEEVEKEALTLQVEGCKVQAEQVADSEEGQNTEMAIGNLKQQNAMLSQIGELTVDTMQDTTACLRRG